MIGTGKRSSSSRTEEATTMEVAAAAAAGRRTLIVPAATAEPPTLYNELEVRILRARQVDVAGDTRRSPQRFFAVAWMEPGDLVQTGARRPHTTFWNETVVCWNHDDVLSFDDDVLHACCLNLQVVSIGGAMADPTSSTGEYVVGSARVRPPRAVSDHFSKGSVKLARLEEISCEIDIEMRLRKREYNWPGWSSFATAIRKKLRASDTRRTERALEEGPDLSTSESSEDEDPPDPPPPPPKVSDWVQAATLGKMIIGLPALPKESEMPKLPDKEEEMLKMPTRQTRQTLRMGFL